MLVSDFDFELPREAIAQHPRSDRDGSRLLRLDRTGGGRSHLRFRDLPTCLEEGDLLVLNNTKVLPARLVGKRSTGGRVEGLILGEASGEGTCRAFLKSKARLREGETLAFEDGALEVRLEERLGGGQWILRRNDSRPLSELLETNGRAPLPPYIRRTDDETPEERREDLERYQTIYAARTGSVAAPTAGLHFTEELLGRLEGQGVGIATVTLHVGPGTFLPVKVDRVEDHAMEEEIYSIDRTVVERVLATRAAGGRVIAVGSTSCRTLETVAARLEEEGGEMPEKLEGGTRLFIHPPYEFRWVDGMITNFHLPRSTLILLVCALAGREPLLAAYEEAVREGYRFYSYGDAMLIV